MENIAVLLNRVFRIENNTLLHAIIKKRDHFDKVYIVLLQEDLSNASALKHDFYYGTFERFLKQLNNLGIKPLVMAYEDFIPFSKTEEIQHVLMASDIMSYHLPEYDAPSMRRALTKEGMNVYLLKVHHYLIPSESLKKDGTAYQVFTPFYRENRTQLTKKELATYDLKVLAESSVPSKEEYAFNYLKKGTDEASATEKWRFFLHQNIQDYNKNREYLSEIKTSQLSITFAYGLIDIQTILNDLLSALQENEEEVEAFIREIMFREFYYVLMTQFPEAATESFKPKYIGLEWANNNEYFEQWTKGKTGYPMIDAAMHQLKETGFMHNRCRMVVSQFLTKDLFIDWRWGEDYFRKHLVDYDNASNVHGWQWSASTGSDAVPYFRMFNPIRQSERFLGDGEYVRQFLPLFQNVPVKYLHEPVKYEATLKEEFNITLGDDYPYFMVDHKIQREHIMEVFNHY